MDDNIPCDKLVKITANLGTKIIFNVNTVIAHLHMHNVHDIPL